MCCGRQRQTANRAAKPSSRNTVQTVDDFTATQSMAPDPKTDNSEKKKEVEDPLQKFMEDWERSFDKTQPSPLKKEEKSDKSVKSVTDTQEKVDVQKQQDKPTNEKVKVINKRQEEREKEVYTDLESMIRLRDRIERKLIGEAKRDMQIGRKGSKDSIKEDVLNYSNRTYD